MLINYIINTVTPHLLPELGPLPRPQNVHGRVGVALGADLSSQRKRAERPGVQTALVKVTDVNLNRPVVLGRDQLVGPAALPRHVKLDDVSVSVLHCVYLQGGGGRGRREREEGERAWASRRGENREWRASDDVGGATEESRANLARTRTGPSETASTPVAPSQSRFDARFPHPGHKPAGKGDGSLELKSRQPDGNSRHPPGIGRVHHCAASNTPGRSVSRVRTRDKTTHGLFRENDGIREFNGELRRYSAAVRLQKGHPSSSTCTVYTREDVRTCGGNLSS